LSINADPETILIDAAFIRLLQRGVSAKEGASIRSAGAAKAN